jgi:hypothetical protein
MAMRVKDEGASECCSAMEQIRVESHATISLGAKASRLPSGHSSQENLVNRLKKQSR